MCVSKRPDLVGRPVHYAPPMTSLEGRIMEKIDDKYGPVPHGITQPEGPTHTRQRRGDERGVPKIQRHGRYSAED